MVLLDVSPVCSAFCGALQAVAGEGVGNVLLIAATSGALWYQGKRQAAKLQTQVSDANGRAARAEERAIRATEHAQLLRTNLPPAGYETITRPSASAPTLQRRDPTPAPRELESEPPSEASEPEPTFGTKNWENVQRELGLLYDEHGNRRAPVPDVSDTSRTTVPQAPRKPPRR